MRILCDPDPPAPGGGGAPADPTPPTAADLAAGGKTPREVALEKRISTLEDKNNDLSKSMADFLKGAETRDRNPSTSITPAALLEETNEFLGWGLS